MRTVRKILSYSSPKRGLKVLFIFFKSNLFELSESQPNLPRPLYGHLWSTFMRIPPFPANGCHDIKITLLKLELSVKG